LTLKGEAQEEISYVNQPKYVLAGFIPWFGPIINRITERVKVTETWNDPMNNAFISNTESSTLYLNPMSLEGVLTLNSAGDILSNGDGNVLKAGFINLFASGDLGTANNHLKIDPGMLTNLSGQNIYVDSINSATHLGYITAQNATIHVNDGDVTLEGEFIISNDLKLEIMNGDLLDEEIPPPGNNGSGGVDPDEEPDISANTATIYVSGTFGNGINNRITFDTDGNDVFTLIAGEDIYLASSGDDDLQFDDLYSLNGDLDIDLADGGSLHIDAMYVDDLNLSLSEGGYLIVDNTDANRLLYRGSNYIQDWRYENFLRIFSNDPSASFFGDLVQFDSDTEKNLNLIKD